jgi:hypothetical protein
MSAAWALAAKAAEAATAIETKICLKRIQSPLIGGNDFNAGQSTAQI